MANKQEKKKRRKREREIKTKGENLKKMIENAKARPFIETNK